MKFLLFPNYMKRTGWVLILMIVPFILSCKYMEMDREISLQVAKLMGILGLIFVILSKEKYPTEALEKLQVYSMAKAFTSMLTMVLVYRLIQLFIPSFRLNEQDLFASSSGLIGWGSMMYFFYYFFGKFTSK